VPAKKFNVVDIFRAHFDEIPAERLSCVQRKLISDMHSCRTAAMGGHLYSCTECDFEQPQYNSCQNRSCPNCQALKQAKWIAEREERLLPVGHHHVVFTLPSELRTLVLYNQRKLYKLLFNSVSKTLSILAKDIFGAQLAVTAVLHTWTRQLSFHPHVHCIVSGGAFRFQTRDQISEWIDLTKYLLPVARMKALFRAQFLAGLHKLQDDNQIRLPEKEKGNENKSDWWQLIHSLPDEWVVHIEAPLGISSHILSYLGRYTHQIAISNKRLINVTDNKVTFHVREGEICTLNVTEFIRRFLLHVLPHGFRKIRHYGLYAPSNVKGRLEQAREILIAQATQEHDSTEPEDLTKGCVEQSLDYGNDDPKWVQQLRQLTGKDPLLCPRCQLARMVCTGIIPRGPPGGNN